MDIRDKVFWFQEAQKKLVQDQLLRLQAARFAMADEGSYQRIYSDLEAQLKQIDGKKSSGWEELKIRRKG